ncbi:hypothetical protein [Thiolinea disciformis]|uniref:hypothetical protein n=1 Tax=Thiolinea disciformis TaxID=125614 RepID=UPI00035E9E4C|nr:hypothetical protein [Thiolinea disciformis]
MFNLTDVLIISLALGAALTAVLLLRPQSREPLDTKRIYKLRLDAEANQQRMGKILETMEGSAKDASQVTEKLREQLAKTQEDSKIVAAKAQITDKTLEQAQQTEQSLRQKTFKLSSQLQEINSTWDNKLSQTVETVQTVQHKLELGIANADANLNRLHEQEKMAQEFTQRLLNYQKNHLSTQQENLRVAEDMTSKLEALLKDAGGTLQTMQQQRQNSDELFQQFCSVLENMQQQVQNQFTQVAEKLDNAQREADQRLEEIRVGADTFQKREQDAIAMAEQIQQQFKAVDALKVDRLIHTVELTDEMCVDLQSGLENAHKLLKLLESKTQQVINEVEHAEDTQQLKQLNREKPLGVAQNSQSNLLAFQAYR